MLYCRIEGALSKRDLALQREPSFQTKIIILFFTKFFVVLTNFFGQKSEEMGLLRLSHYYGKEKMKKPRHYPFV